MNPLTVVALLNWFLLPALVLTAPTSNRPQTLRQAAEQTKVVVDKVLEDVRASYAAAVTMPGLTLSPPSRSAELDTMRERLDIPNAPVIKPLSETFQLDVCVARLAAGVQLHQELLGVLAAKLNGLGRLNSDIRDLKLRVDKMKEVGQLSGASGSDQNSSSDLASRLDTDYKVQVALHLTLTQLQSFCHDVIRSLRNIQTTFRPRAAGSR